jgi:hypothetical protein
MSSAEVANADRSPRSARRLVTAAFHLYRRYPLLFLVLAAGVVVPYESIVLAITGAGPFSQGALGFGTSSLLTLIDWVLIGPLISALHVHAVAAVREGRDPRLAAVARQGLLVLPVVVAASIVSGLGIALGLLALAVPGIILMLRWFVVAQTAAIEHEGWLPALRRSAQLTDGHYGHIFIFLIYTGLIVSVPTLLIGLAFGHGATTAASFLVGVGVRIVATSFTALATALLYYDLRSRREAAVATVAPGGIARGGGDPPANGHALDPRAYSDEDRPKGWYINPRAPGHMSYWGAGDPPDWGATTRTPRKVRREWEAGQGGTGEGS